MSPQEHAAFARIESRRQLRANLRTLVHMATTAATVTAYAVAMLAIGYAVGALFR